MASAKFLFYFRQGQKAANLVSPKRASDRQNSADDLLAEMIQDELSSSRVQIVRIKFKRRSTERRAHPTRDAISSTA